MKFPSCPYCLKDIYSYDFEISCINDSHEFWSHTTGKPPNWNIYLSNYQVNIDNNELSVWNELNQRVVIQTFDNISPEDGAQIIKRYINLKSFL